MVAVGRLSHNARPEGNGHPVSDWVASRTSATITREQSNIVPISLLADKLLADGAIKPLETRPPAPRHESRMNIAKKLIAFIVLAGVVIGAFVIVVTPMEMYQKWKAESWPSSNGTITRSRARQHFNFHMGRNGTPYWEPEICGSYVDSGEAFCVRRVTLGLHVGDHTRPSVDKMVARYPVGREVQVYYSPEDVNDTTLEPQSSWHELFIALGLAIGFVTLPWLLRAGQRL